MRAWPRALVVLTALLAGAMASACELLVEFAVDAERPDATDASTDVTTEEASIGPCGPIPSPPEPTDTTTRKSLLFAMVQWGLEPKEDPSFWCANPGLNLDDKFTGGPNCDEQASCVRHPLPLELALIYPQASQLPCDDDGGVDDLTTKLLKFVHDRTGGARLLSREEFDQLLDRGVYNILLQVDDYNGTENDDVVQIGFYVSSGMDGVDASVDTGVPGRGLGADTIALLPPVWDGGQDATWHVEERSAAILPGQIIQPKRVGPGYVRDGILVARSGGFGFELPGFFLGGNATLNRGVFMARIVRDGSRFRLTHGRMAGGIASANVLGTFGGASASGTIDYCDPSKKDEYKFLRGGVCAALDLPAHLAQPDQPCSELSVTFSMHGIQSAVTTVDGLPVLGHSFVRNTGACPEPDGSIWCDDCAWDEPGRCADPTLDAGSD